MADSGVKNGGPAFPCPHQSAPELGIFLRDYFAILAPLYCVKELVRQHKITSCAARYRWADDMLAERSK